MNSLPAIGRKWAELPSHRRWLRQQADHLFAFYQHRCLHPDGGFHSLDADGAPLPTGWPVTATPTCWLFATTRFVHCFSIGHLLGIPGSERIVDAGMDFLWTRHRDSRQGGYHWGVGAKGQLSDPSKQAYGHAFVLLAASSAKVVGHPDADRLLADITEVLQTRFWEEAHGAMAEEFQADWKPLSSYRGQNSNMHLTEACLAAFEATGDGQYLEMARRIATLLIRQITAANDWRLPEHFDENWRMLPDFDQGVFRPFGSTIGHWLEWSRLLLQLWELEGRRSDWLREAANRLFRKAVEEGWSSRTGGFYFAVDWQGRPVNTDRYWWTLAEGIGAASFLNQIEDDPFYEEWYRRIWNWTNEHLIDHERGGWHPQLNDDLERITDPFWGKPDLYHALQSCLIPLLPTKGSITHGLRAAALES